MTPVFPRFSEEATFDEETLCMRSDRRGSFALYDVRHLRLYSSTIRDARIDE
jgi:hypothetical protein